jgi:predicted amidophosphoribosyltransferase
MPVQAVCCFTHLTSTDFAWTDPHYCVKKFVDALKRRPINKSAYIPVGRGPKRKLTQDNAGHAVLWFGEMAAELLSQQPFGDKPILVPYPSSKCTPAVRVAKTKRLATATASRFTADVADIIRYVNEQPSAHEEDGTRDPALIYPELTLTGEIAPDRPYVLIDDVLTSGGHARAGVALLRENGATVSLVVCGVKASQVPVADHFARTWVELADYEP